MQQKCFYCGRQVAGTDSAEHTNYNFAKSAIPAKNASAGRQVFGTIAAQGNTIQQKMLLLYGRQDVGTIAAQGNTIQQKMLLLWQAGAGTDAAGSTAIQQNLLGIRL